MIKILIWAVLNCKIFFSFSPRNAHHQLPLTVGPTIGVKCRRFYKRERFFFFFSPSSYSIYYSFWFTNLSSKLKKKKKIYLLLICENSLNCKKLIYRSVIIGFATSRVTENPEVMWGQVRFLVGPAVPSLIRLHVDVNFRAKLGEKCISTNYYYHFVYLACVPTLGGTRIETSP